MGSTGFVAHEDCSRHDTGWRHPDHQGRLRALVRAVYKDLPTLHQHLHEIVGRPAGVDDLRLIHTDAHIERIREHAARSGEEGSPLPLEEGIVLSGASWEAALAAAGTAITAVEAVLDGEARNAFACARPPGKSARQDTPGGFSLFNNVAIAAEHLRQRKGISRILIVDWGADPSPATEEIFADDPEVRVVALRPALSGSEAASRSTDVGGGDAFPSLFREAVAAAGAELEPEFVLLSADFDTLASDPTTEMPLVPEDFTALTRAVLEVAESHAGGRLVSVLEGGYDPAATGDAVVHHLRVLAGVS